MEPLTFEDFLHQYRTQLRVLGTSVHGLLNNEELSNHEDLFKGQTDEIKANLMLAFRHIEDARMRLGKVLQAENGGESCFKD
jgi:hypothetical protein